MPFSISFLDEPIFYDEQMPFACGELVLGDYKETFYANLFQWSKEDYEAQWHNAIQTLLDGSHSALMVHFVDQEFAANFEWWKMYREDQVVYFQNQLPWYSQFNPPFHLEDLSRFVGERKTVNEDGDRYSEWTVPLVDIEDFAKTLWL
jgi:hypothetical protein